MTSLSLHLNGFVPCVGTRIKCVSCNILLGVLVLFVCVLNAG